MVYRQDSLVLVGIRRLVAFIFGQVLFIFIQAKIKPLKKTYLSNDYDELSCYSKRESDKGENKAKKGQRPGKISLPKQVATHSPPFLSAVFDFNDDDDGFAKKNLDGEKANNFFPLKSLLSWEKLLCGWWLAWFIGEKVKD